MRVYVQVFAVLTAGKLASAVACPFGTAAEAGLLSDADSAKYEAVKRDGIASEPSTSLHKKDAITETRRAQSARVANGLLPIGLLGLPLLLGGGLGELTPIFQLLNAHEHDRSEWSVAATHRPSISSGAAYTASTLSKSYPWQRFSPSVYGTWVHRSTWCLPWTKYSCQPWLHFA